MQQYANDPSTSLNGAILAAAATLVVHSSSGFPSSGDFTIRIDDEYLLVTNVSGTTWTVSRGQEASTAADHLDAAVVVMPLTAGSLSAVGVQSHGGTVVASRRQTNFVDGGGVTWTVADDPTNKKTDVSASVTSGSVEVAHGGTLVGTRAEINFIDGGGVTWTLTDDAGGNKVDVSAVASGGGGSAGFERSFTVPALASYTWQNQGSATANDDGQGVFIDAPAAGQNNLRSLDIATGAAPWTFICKIVPFMFEGGSANCGLYLRDSSGGKRQSFRFINGTLDSVFWNSNTSFNNGGPLSAVTIDPSTPFTWFKVQDDSTNRIYSVSSDGNNWIQLCTQARTSTLTADRIGFYAEAGSSNEVGVKLVSALLTSP